MNNDVGEFLLKKGNHNNNNSNEYQDFDVRNTPARQSSINTTEIINSSTCPGRSINSALGPPLPDKNTYIGLYFATISLLILYMGFLYEAVDHMNLIRYGYNNFKNSYLENENNYKIDMNNILLDRIDRTEKENEIGDLRSMVLYRDHNLLTKEPVGGTTVDDDEIIITTSELGT